MNPIEMDNIVLYYPTIEFQSDAWLKSALCVWDQIYRIVPPGYTPHDSEEVLEAAESGAIYDLHLKPEDLRDTARRFESFLDQLPFIPAGADGPPDVEVRLHPEKIDARIRPIFQALASKIDPHGFLKLSSRLADSYMLFLCEEVSRRRRIPKLTDNQDMFAIIQYFMNDGNFGEDLYDESSSECTCALVIEEVLPSGVESTRMKEVLEIRQASKEGRRQFRRTIASFVQDLALVEDVDRAKELVEAFRDRTESDGRVLSNVLKDLGKELLRSSLIVGLPIAIPVLLGSSALSPTTPGTGLVTLGIAMVAAIADAARSRRHRWKSSDAAYYLELKRRLGPGKEISPGHRNFRYLLNEFIND